MNKTIIQKGKYLIYAVSLAVISTYIYIHFEQTKRILLDNFPLFLSITALSIVALANQTFGYLQNLKSLKLKRADVLYVWSLSSLVNYLGPFQPGIAFRSLHLRKHGISIQESLSASLIWAGLSAVTGISLLCAFFLFTIESQHKSLAITAICLVVILTIFVLKWCKPLVAKIDFFKKSNRRQITLTFLHSTLQYIIIYFAYDISYASLGATISGPALILLSITIPLSTLIAITPNGVGVLETLIAATGYANDIPTEKTLAIILLFRASHIAACILIITFYLLLKEYTKHLKRER